MLTGTLCAKIDQVWNAFWAGGIANPIEMIEQITYLLFMRGLDEAHTREENKAHRLHRPMERRVFPKARTASGRRAASPTKIAARWAERNGTEQGRARTAQSFCVPKAEIAAAGYDLSINRYKEVVREIAEHRPPKEIIAEPKALEKEIARGLEELEGCCERPSPDEDRGACRARNADRGDSGRPMVGGRDGSPA